VIYADRAIGELSARWAPGEEGRERALLAHGARQIAFMARRYDVCRWAEERLGRHLLLVGTSAPILDLEVFVEKAAHSDLPVLLQGEFGTEIPYLAAAIHCSGPCRDRPFVQVNCAHPADDPESWFAQAGDGTLFLSDIDALEGGLQNRLPQYMSSRLGHWLDVSGAPRVRVVASTTADPRRLVAEGRFSRPLLAELDFLSVTVPPLRRRPADIEPLVAAVLDRHGFRPDDKIGPDLLALCRAYGWPENAYELERVIARLAVMTGKGPIRSEDIGRHAPHMAPAPVGPDPSGDGDGLSWAGMWVRSALRKEVEALSGLHPNLRKAVVYLADHYAEPIRLEALARQAHVSQSHLSFLFRSGLQMSCKSLLARIRIERAKELLTEDRRQPVTDVALQVGFADLSHFEKCFRREVGLSPRQFRRAAAE
jgi:DNA-binding NtrC family response regulator